MIKTALFILAIELAVIGWVRWRYGREIAARAPSARRCQGQNQQPATNV